MAEHYSMHLDEGSIFSFTDPNYSPLVLMSSNREHPEDDWELNFQLRPEPKIIFKGDKIPTMESIVELLRWTPHMPIWFIEIIQVCAGNELRLRKEKATNEQGS